MQHVSVHAGDIHWGAGDPELLEKELDEYLYGFVKENSDVIDSIHFSGDWFEQILSANDKSSKLAIKFGKKVSDFGKTHKIRVRMLKGTESHDFTQLDHFKIFEDEDGYFKVIDTVTVEYLAPDFKVLYIPEEYPKDKEEFYKEFLNPQTPYNMIVGHGTIKFQAFSNQTCESERPIASAPVFEMEELADICTGPIIFGHIHTRCNWKEKIYYHGSFSRTAFGEPGAKGFCYAQMDDDGFDVTYVDNESSPEYASFEFDKMFEQGQGDLQQVISMIRNAAEKFYKVRIRFAESYHSEMVAELTAVREAIRDLRNVKVETRKKMSVELEGEVIIDENGNETVVRDDKFDFLIGGHTQPYATISEYIKVKMEIELSADEVQTLVEEEFSE